MPDKIPRHEPEVMAAAQRKRPGSEKIHETSLHAMEIHGIQISSRYNKIFELDAMCAMVNAIPPELCGNVRQIFCDSQACALYEVAVRRWDPFAMEAICHALHMAAVQSSRGHNGIHVNADDKPHGWSVHLDPWWGEEGDYQAPVYVCVQEGQS